MDMGEHGDETKDVFVELKRVSSGPAAHISFANMFLEIIKPDGTPMDGRANICLDELLHAGTSYEQRLTPLFNAASRYYVTPSELRNLGVYTSDGTIVFRVTVVAYMKKAVRSATGVFMKNIGGLMDKKEFADMKIIVPDKPKGTKRRRVASLDEEEGVPEGTTAIDACRPILAARSPVIATLLSSKMQESTTRTWHIPDATKPVVQQMLTYIYKDEFKAAEYQLADAEGLKELTKLMELADRYELHGLANQVISSISGISTVSPDMFSAATQLVAMYAHSPHYTQSFPLLIASVATWYTSISPH